MEFRGFSRDEQLIRVKQYDIQESASKSLDEISLLTLRNDMSNEHHLVFFSLFQISTFCHKKLILYIDR